MSTNFPTSYDDLTNLGGPFIDVAPPVDLQRDIAAAYRNNIRDSVIAVEARLGTLGIVDNATIDWGLLTVGTSPNQGLRFAGVHTGWPGDASEGGIFLKNTTGNPNFHKAGDPVGTYTDLTTGGGGISDWDALYGAAQTMAINGSTLTWTHTTTSTGFEVERNVPLSTILLGTPMLQLTDVGVDDGGAAAPLFWVKEGRAVVEGRNTTNTTGATFTVYRPNAGNILEILDGDFSSATQRLLFDKTGRLVLTTDAASFSEAVEINQNSSQAFLQLNGGAGAQRALWEESGRLSITANTVGTATLDIIQSNVGGGLFRAQGSVSNSTVSIGEAGTFYVETGSTPATNVLLKQAIDGQPFFGFVGTEGVGTTHTISTDSDPTAKMLRVEVDGGGGGATYWIPTYASPTIPVGSTATLQSAYTAGNTITTAGSFPILISGPEHFYWQSNTSNQFSIGGAIATTVTTGLFSVGCLAGADGVIGVKAGVGNPPGNNGWEFGAFSAEVVDASDLDDTDLLYAYEATLDMQGNGPLVGTCGGVAFYARSSTFTGSNTYFSVGLSVDASFDYAIFSRTGGGQIAWGSPTEVFHFDTNNLTPGLTSPTGVRRDSIKVASAGALFHHTNLYQQTLAGGGDSLGGISQLYSASSLGGSTAPLGSATASGNMTSVKIEHGSDGLDTASSWHEAIHTEFTFVSSGGGINDLGASAHGLYLSLPESVSPAGLYHNNDGTFAFSRWSIYVEEGESHLRRTEFTSTTDLGKALVRFDQQDNNAPFHELEGFHGGSPTVPDCSLTQVNAGAAVVGPLDGSWNYLGMYQVYVIDRAGTIPSGHYWVPLYEAI